LRFSDIAKAVALTVCIAAPASAAVVVPDTGTTDYLFQWTGGLGPITSIQGENGAFDWSLTLAVESDVTFTVTDDYVAGDAFGLVLDFVPTPWTTSGMSGSFFTGTYAATLGPGTYIFGLELTELAPGYTSGAAPASFTVAPTVVPLAASLPLLVGALGVAGLVARRRSRS